MSTSTDVTPDVTGLGFEKLWDAANADEKQTLVRLALAVGMLWRCGQPHCPGITVNFESRCAWCMHDRRD